MPLPPMTGLGILQRPKHAAALTCLTLYVGVNYTGMGAVLSGPEYDYAPKLKYA